MTTRLPTRPTGKTVNDIVLESGVVPLVDLSGDRIWFYPRGRLPRHVAAYLDVGNGHHARLLRDFIVTLGRDIP